MDRIIIEVDKQVAKAFMQTDKFKRAEINKVINAWLKKIVNNSASTEYKKFLDSISNEAMKNGLNEDKLQKLLKVQY